MQEYVEKELNAVDSEFKKNLPDDSWRCFQIMTQLAKPDSPFRKFTIGNKETLGKENSKLEMENFWRKFYSSNLMTVILYGTETVDQIFESAVPILNQIENREYKAPLYRDLGPQFTENELSRYIKFNSLNDEDYLRIIWFFPPCFSHK